MNAQTTFFRRLTSPLRRGLCAMSAVCLSFAGSPAVADAVTMPDMLIGVTQGFLEFTVEDYLASSQTQGRYEIEVKQLDPRLRLPMCDKELTATLESPAQPFGRVTVKVRCDGASPWTVFVPGQVQLYREVVTAARPLQRDMILTANDLALAERDVGLISQGYLNALKQAVGKKLTRPLLPDQVLTPAHLQMAEVARASQHRVLKIKADASLVIERLRAIRLARPDAELIVDANQSWTTEILARQGKLLADLGGAGIVARLAAGDIPVAAARYANAAAALSTQGYGAVAPIPRAADVRAALAAVGLSGFEARQIGMSLLRGTYSHEIVLRSGLPSYVEDRIPHM